METLWRDLRYAIRTLGRSPGFTLIAILTLALGIGANTAIFSVVDTVVLSPLPYHHPDQLVIVWQNNPQRRHISPSYPDIQDWQQSTHSFEGIAAFAFHPYDLTNPGSPEHLSGWQICSGFFKILGVDPILGRDFSAEEDLRGGAQVAIISDRVWKERFSGSSGALGKVITLDGADYTIVGVVPSGINLGGAVDVYTPISQGDPLTISDRRTHAFLAIGRLKPGTNLSQAKADTNAVEKTLGELYPKFDRGLTTDVVPLKDAVTEDVSGIVLMLFGSVGLVLLIACANVAGLFLARAAAREREFAIRTALGAKRSRLIWQMIAESVLLALAGGTLGLAVAKWGVRPLLAAVPGDFPRPATLGLNASVLLFTLGTSVVVGIVFGLVPAWKNRSISQQTALKQGGHGSTSVHHRTQSSLVIAQTALTLVLLVGAGLLFRTIRHLWTVNPGFDANQLVTFKAGIAPDLLKSPQAMRVAYQQLIDRIQRIAGVQAADLTTLLPLSGMDNEIPFWLGPNEPQSIAEAPRVLTYSVGPDYFRTMGIPLLRGRLLAAGDTPQSERVIIIDSATAETYFHSTDPIGQTLSFARVGPFRIIGVVGHVRHWGLDKTGPYNQAQAYTSFYQISDEWLPIMRTDASIVVRTRLALSSLMPAIKSAIYGEGSEQPIYDIQTMQQAVSSSMASQSFPMILLGGFAALALVLASVGIYGLLANFVQRRTQEIGIRMALGAQRQDVFRMMIQQGLKLTLTGIAVGAAASLILTRTLPSFSHLLYGVGAGDPLTLAAAAVLLVATAVLACYIPARRATMVAPTVALRQE